MKYPKAGGLIKKDEKRELIGNDCLKYMGIINIKYPLEHGMFKEPDDIEILLDYIYTNLDINLSEIKEHPVLIAEPLLNPKENRQNIAKVLFDTHKIEYLFFASQPVLSLYSTSSASGAVLESGEGVSQSCIVYEGYSLPNTYERFDYGGGDVTNVLKILMKKKGYQLLNSNEYRFISDMKEKYCFLLSSKYNLNFDNVRKALNAQKINYYLPDGTSISLGDERIIASEILFTPELIGKEFLGLSDIILSSINKAEIQLRPKAYENIVLSGGNILMKGLEDKIKEDIIQKHNKIVKLNVNTIKEPKISCWVGGNIISSLDIFNNISITKKEWEEKGNKIIHVKTI
jgi:centractin